MTEKAENKIEINDSTPVAVKGMLNHIYTGAVPDNIHDIVADLLHLAHKYELPSLKRACEKTLVEELVAENAINTFILADRQES